MQGKRIFAIRTSASIIFLLQTLFITAGGSLWSVEVTDPGRPVWPAPK